MATMKISKKGWIVIPKEIRERHHLHPGDKVQVIDLAGRISIVPAMENPVQEIRGMFAGGDSLTKALLEERREELEREERKLATEKPAARKKAS